jgi:hypothetical protein
MTRSPATTPYGVVLGELALRAGGCRGLRSRVCRSTRSESWPSRTGADADAIHRLTQGNAFYVTEVLAARGGSLPETVRDAVLARAAGLAPEARRLLDAVSLVPARGGAAGWSKPLSPAELEHLDECLASGMLRADGDGVAFRHELARIAVESAVSPYRRRALHAEIVIALEPTRDHSRLAHHAEEAGDSTAVARARAGGGTPCRSGVRRTARRRPSTRARAAPRRRLGPGRARPRCSRRSVRRHR